MPVYAQVHGVGASFHTLESGALSLLPEVSRLLPVLLSREDHSGTGEAQRRARVTSPAQECGSRRWQNLLGVNRWCFDRIWHLGTDDVLMKLTHRLYTIHL